jgi:hypothetical protein
VFAAAIAREDAGIAIGTAASPLLHSSDYITPEFTAIDAQLWTSGGIVAKTDAAWHADRSIPEGGPKETQVRRGACMDYEPVRPELIGGQKGSRHTCHPLKAKARWTILGADRGTLLT